MLLANGKVLVLGGDGTSLVQMYDPSTGRFEAAGNMVAIRAAPKVALLRDGKVLVAGGKTPPYGDELASAELYDPISGTFTLTGSLTGCHSRATMLLNGMVLFTGAQAPWEGLCSNTSPINAGTELYDPSKGTFDFVLDPNLWRSYGHSATLLPNGMVLVAGGATVVPSGVAATVRTAELFSYP